MRENLSMGKRLKTGEWVEGYHVHLHNSKGFKSDRIYTGDVYVDAYSVIEELFVVDPKTVGRFTGLSDKNSKKIFEGDIVQIDGHETAVNGLYCVRWSEINSCWTLQRNEEYHHHFFTFSALNGFAETSEIVGNIHDDKELLKGES